MADIILFSGGMDSVALAYLYPDAYLLHVLLGTQDEQSERSRLSNVAPGGSRLISVPLVLNLWELENKIIPFRNAFLIMVAAQYGRRVYLGATIGDTTRDKDETFAHHIGTLLNYICPSNQPDKSPPHQSWPFEVLMPFKGLSKRDIVKRFISAGHPVDILINSWSCYSGGEKECGVCRACLRKYCALAFNPDNVARLDNHFVRRPRANDLLVFLEGSRVKKRHPSEIKSIEETIRLVGGKHETSS